MPKEALRPICPQLRANHTCKHAPERRCPLMRLEGCLEPSDVLRPWIESEYAARLQMGAEANAVEMAAPSLPPPPTTNAASASTPERRGGELARRLAKRRADHEAAQDNDHWLNSLPAEAFQTRPNWRATPPPRPQRSDDALFEAHLAMLRASPAGLEERAQALVDACFSEPHRVLVGNRSAVRLINHLLLKVARLRLEGHTGDGYIATTAQGLAAETGLGVRTVKGILSRGKSRLGYAPAVDTWLRRAVLYDGRQVDGSGGSCVGTVLRVSLEPHPLEGNVVPSMHYSAWQQIRTAWAAARLSTSRPECKKSEPVVSIPSEEETAKPWSIVLPGYPLSQNGPGWKSSSTAMHSECKSVREARAARDITAERRARAAMERLGERESSFALWYGAFRKTFEAGDEHGRQVFAVVSDAFAASLEGRLHSATAGAYAVGILKTLGLCRGSGQERLHLAAPSALEVNEIHL